jgi:hypothetical protein
MELMATKGLRSSTAYPVHLVGNLLQLFFFHVEQNVVVLWVLMLDVPGQRGQLDVLVERNYWPRFVLGVTIPRSGQMIEPLSNG